MAAGLLVAGPRFPRWTSRIIGFGMITAAIPIPTMLDLADRVGVPPNALYASLRAPVVIAGFRLILLLRRSYLFRSLVLVIVLSATSLAWTGHDNRSIGVQLVFGLALMLAWKVLIATVPDSLGRLSRAGHWVIAYAVIVTILNPRAGYAFTGAEDLAPAFNVITVALFAQLIRATYQGRRASVWTGAYYLVCLGLLALSTFRAVTIGAALGLIYLAFKERGSIRAAGALLFGLLVVLTPTLLAESYNPTSDRSDLAARYASVGEDRFSGRLDIWEEIRRSVETDPSVLLTGVGVGDVAVYVGAAVLPEFAAPTEYLGAPARISTHNAIIEMTLSLGIAGLALAIAIAIMIYRRLWRREPALWAFWLTIALVVGANVPGYDFISGGALLVGVGLGVLLYSKPAISVEVP